MFAKVFTQIFDSSIAEDWRVRHVFEDLLKLCDCDGVVDMTHEAIARRTNVPLKVVRMAIEALSGPDERSRSKHSDGRRIVLLDDHRDWGWQIVNYRQYRELRSEEDRRAYMRDYMRQKRKNTKENDDVNTCKQSLAKLAKEEAEEEEEVKEDVKAPRPPEGALNVERSKVESSRSRVGKREAELMKRCAGLLEPAVMATYGGSWRKRARNQPDLLERILDALEEETKRPNGAAIECRGAWCNDLWQRWGGNL